ncbi:MAG: hypothetical protein M3Q81_04940 [bacterium]|nr:hypothetical protein [bacterium]
MDKITATDLKKLSEQVGSHLVSVYFPTDSVGLESPKRSAKWKNIEREVVSKLEAADVPKSVVTQIKEQFQVVQSTDEMWLVEQKAIAIFISPSFSACYRLPITVKKVIDVGTHFHLKPLIKLATEERDFYLLALAQKSITIYHGDRYALKEVSVPDMPDTIEAVVGTENTGSNVQFHTSTAGPQGGNRPAMYHGSSSWKDDLHRYKEKFLQQVGSAIEKYLRTQHAPLILSGVERMLTTYKDVNTYKYFVPEVFLSEKTDVMPLTEIHEAAFEALGPYFLERAVAKVSEVVESGSDEKFSTQIDEILRQASMGKVDTLVVAEDAVQWGSFDADTLSTTYAEQSTTNTYDLLDLATLLTLDTSGVVQVLPQEDLPLQASAVAIFRY